MITIDKPGIYPDVQDPVYYADPCPQPSLSASVGKLFIKGTARKVWEAHRRLNPAYEETFTAHYDFGKVLHQVLTGEGGGVKILHFDSFRSGDAKKARDAARNAGLVPILAKDYEAVDPMAEAIRVQLNYSEDAQDAFVVGKGRGEVTEIWQEQPDPSLPAVWCRAKMDWLSDRGIIFDLKTTADDAGPDEFGARTIWNYDYQFQWSFYRRGMQALTGKDHPFIWVVVEKDHPYSVAIHTLSGQAMEIADAEVDDAIRKWQWCMAKGVWPGYSRKTYWNDAPVWKSKVAENRELSKALTVAEIERGMLFQAPAGFDAAKLPTRAAISQAAE